MSLYGERGVSLEAQTRTNEAKITALLPTSKRVNVHEISFAREKKKTRVFLFFEIYKMKLKYLKSDNLSSETFDIQSFRHSCTNNRNVWMEGRCLFYDTKFFQPVFNDSAGARGGQGASNDNSSTSQRFITTGCSRQANTVRGFQPNVPSVFRAFVRAHFGPFHGRHPSRQRHGYRLQRPPVALPVPRPRFLRWQSTTSTAQFAAQCCFRRLSRNGLSSSPFVTLFNTVKKNY